jgi:transcriptional regulator with XRE-family HTH domain
VPPQRYRSLADYFIQTGRTQESLASKLGVTPAYISLLTSGSRQPGLKLALRIEAMTGLPVEALAANERKAS